MKKNFHFFVIFYMLFTLTNTLFALEKEDIPSALKEWEAWVLDDVKDLECPLHYQSNKRICSWPSIMSVELIDKRLDFNITWKLFKDNSKITLPGDRDNWAFDVKVDGKKAIVLDEGKHATLILDKGLHLISGTFEWKNSPKYLQLPQNIALVNLYKNGQKISQTRVDKNARLWFDDEGENSVQKGSVVVSIYRKVIDEHPMKMRTYLYLRVSGKARSVVLDGVMVDEFLPLSVHSKLDAAITNDRKLQLEVKAGEWIVQIDSYNPKPVLKLQKPKSSFKYANEEVWVFKSKPKYRTLKIEGAQAIDPSQTNLPASWKKLPAYLMQDKTEMSLKELYQNEQNYQRNKLSLNRQIWLDFDGEGYTFLDNIAAKIEQIQRLETTTLLDLGSASVNGKPELITTLKKSEQKGVELRASELNIKALSRYEGDISLLPANGWDEKFTSVTTKLNLPPGWRLFASFGSDDRGNAWLDNWDLMDIFLVLLFSIAIYQLYGWKWAVPSFVFIVMLWQESEAPTIIWLILLAFVALLRVLEKGYIKKFLKVGFVLSIGFVVWQVLSFSVYEIRTALYPQLETHHSYSNYRDRSMDMAETTSYESSKQIIRGKLQKEMKNAPYIKQAPILENKIDPNAVVQTGPGVPTWAWKSHNFSWQSGVGSDDRLELWLISPLMNKILNILRIIGMLFLLYMFLRQYSQSIICKIKNTIASKESVKAIALILILTLSPNSLKADIPNPKLLEELKKKLTLPPECLPHCVQIQKAALSAANDTLKVQIHLSAGADVSVPILGNRDIWLPKLITLNENEAVNLRLDEQGNLWIKVPKGVHEIKLEGSIKGFESIALSSLLPLHNLETSHDSSWIIESDNRSFIELKNLNFKAVQDKKKAQSSIEPLVQIERTFHFGLRWYIDTDVRILNSIDKPYTLSYNLISGESVLDKAIEVNNGKALIHLKNGQTNYRWRSTLPLHESIKLTASDEDHITEMWKMDVAPLWNMTYEGIKPIEQVKTNNIIMPLYKPWQKEKLTLTFEKAKAVKGKSLTIESSNLQITQSQQYRDVVLNLQIKSSRAQQYIITLKDADELKSATIDGKDHYLKLDNGKVSLPLQAKTQNIKLSWRQQQNSQTNYAFSNINLSSESVNNKITLNLPQNRWILWTSGPLLGPAVLFWGVILALLLFAFLLGKAKVSPLKTRDWFLLGLGVSTTSIVIILPIVVWVLALRYRQSQGDKLKGNMRNLLQVGLVVLTFIALSTIIGALSIGLLGTPDMMIAGNNSYGYQLNWYSDRITNELPQPTIISVSIWYYRALMLLWAIWISFSLISWLKWAWSVFSQGEMWSRKKPKILNLTEKD